MGMQALGVLMLPCLCYLLYRRWYLNQNELMMLLTCCLMLVGLAFGGWLCTFIYLLTFGYHNLIVFQTARCTHLFSRRVSVEFSSMTECFFTVSQNELKLVLYLMYFWILARIISLKSLTFDLGGGTLLSLISGWNCALADLWVLNGLWLLLLIGALLACWFLIRHDRESQTLYKIYLLKHKVILDMAINLFVVVYHYQVFMHSQSLKDCLLEYESGSWARCIWFWGLPASTLWFFWSKQGVFEEGGSAKTENGENQLQKQMNSMSVNEQYDRSRTSRRE